MRGIYSSLTKIRRKVFVEVAKPVSYTHLSRTFLRSNGTYSNILITSLTKITDVNSFFTIALIGASWVWKIASGSYNPWWLGANK